MTRLARELRPALSAIEMAEADDVHRHAQQHDIKLRSNHHVKVVVRCNQLGPTFDACQWSVKLETTATDAVHDAKVKLWEHLEAAHPYLRRNERARVVGSSWVNLRDIGT